MKANRSSKTMPLKNPKSENLKHFLIKCLIYKRLTELNHRANINYTPYPNINFDVIDWTSGTVYQVTPKFKIANQKELESKYTQFPGVKNLIVVTPRKFQLASKVTTWYKNIKDILS